MPAVFVYLSCSETKRATLGAHVALGRVAQTLTADALEPAMRRWQQAVDAIEGVRRVRAIDLYGGGVWGELRETERNLRDGGVQIRIVSAGLGLLNPDDQVPSYNATFASGCRNSIGGKHGAVERNREWWRLLGQWKRGWHGPRSIYATVRSHRDAAHVIALPLDYMDAVLEDVNEIMNDEECRKRTVVLVTPYSCFGRRIPGTVEVSGDLYGALGGTRGTVLARTALFLAEKLKANVTDCIAVAEALAPLRKKAQPLPVRTTQSDAEVAKYIRGALRKTATIARTTLLRDYRASGYACEYTRFRKIHAATKADL
jgi:hypothetical protein